MKNFWMFIIFAIMTVASVIVFVSHVGEMSVNILCLSVIGIVMEVTIMSIFGQSEWIDDEEENY